MDLQIKRLHLHVCVALVLVVASASHLQMKDTTTAIKLHSLKTPSAESLEVVYRCGDQYFQLASRVSTVVPLSWKESTITSYLVSTVSLLDDEMETVATLSRLVIPEMYQLKRKVPDLEKRVVHSAKDMLDVVQTYSSSLLPLADFVHLYDAMINDLVQRIDVQSRFNQGRASIIYHVSVAKTAQRLADGTSPKEACPAHQAYEHKGLFACQQEYSTHAQRVISSPLMGCKDPSCAKQYQRALGQYIEKEIQGLSPQQAVKVVEDTLSLGNNSQLAEDIARLIACGNVTCKEPGCDNWWDTDGWFIFGADWGCCGDYAGCCYLATEVCLTHDAICTCCSFPTFCLDPFCKPDPWCSNMTTTASP